MNRAGREPAEDVKRRLVAVCQEVGLAVAYATMDLLPDANVRVIHVGASLPGWAYQTSTIALMVVVPVSGAWPDAVDIRCCASESDPARMDGAWMTGRERVPFPDLVAQLRATLEERTQVIDAIRDGISGPHRFERTVWGRVDLLREM